MKDIYKRMSEAHRHLAGTWAIVPFIMCMILSMYLSHRVTEYCVIHYSRGRDAWDEGIRLIRTNSRELTDGSQLTIPEYSIRIIAIVIFTMLAYAFWMLVLAYLKRGK